MTKPFPAARMQLSVGAPRQFAAMYKLETSVDLDRRLAELVRVRASQINGCAFCLDMHWKNARALGESEDRLYLLDAWAESPSYDEREQAALELCEAMTLINGDRVPDDVWFRATAVFDEAELAQLVFTVTVINAWNRLMITARVEPGHYQPDMAPVTPEEAA